MAEKEKMERTDRAPLRARRAKKKVPARLRRTLSVKPMSISY